MTERIVYFSSVSENTHRFINKLGMNSTRIPVHTRCQHSILVEQPYVLIIPTYGSGAQTRAVPPQVVKFLNSKSNRDYLRGVISAGNTNFGMDYCLAGRVVSAKCRVPELYRFELLGTPRDVDTVRSGLIRFWQNERNM